jgi:hypothetical protein
MMAKGKGKRKGSKHRLRIVPAAIVLKDTGIIDAVDVAMDPNASLGSVADQIQPPGLGTLVDVGIAKIMRGVVGPIELGKFGKTTISVL